MTRGGFWGGECKLGWKGGFLIAPAEGDHVGGAVFQQGDHVVSFWVRFSSKGIMLLRLPAGVCRRFMWVERTSCLRGWMGDGSGLHGAGSPG